MLESFLTPFLAILLAEMLDKSQLALIFLATRTKNYISLLLGALLAFAVVDGTAIIFGSIVAEFVPENIVKIIAALIFIVFGVLSFRKEEDEEAEKKPRTNNIFLSAFLLIFFAEWADKTQLASAAFATQFNPVLVFAGVMAAMTVLALLAVFAGKLIAGRVKKSLIQKAAGVAFIAIGIYLLFF